MKEFNREILQLVIRPTLLELDLYSPSSEKLVFCTGLAESQFSQVEQGYNRKDGPALGFYQCEPETYYCIFKNYLQYRPELELKLMQTCRLSIIPKAEALVWHVKLATAICRIHYLRVPDPLPEVNDIRGMARYWKEHYNSGGKGTIEHFLEAYENR